MTTPTMVSMQEVERSSEGGASSAFTALVPWLFLLCSAADQGQAAGSQSSRALLKAAMRTVAHAPTIHDHGLTIAPAALLHCSPLAAGTPPPCQPADHALSDAFWVTGS